MDGSGRRACNSGSFLGWKFVIGGMITLGLISGALAADPSGATGNGMALRGVSGAGSVMVPSVQSPLVGAYYSDWFPANSAQGTLRQHLVPAQGADPTKVNSASPVVAEQAIALASRSGISFFALDYWPDRPSQNRNINAFLRAKNLNEIRFCLLYETWDLGFEPAHEATPVTPALETKFDANLLQFARTYFTNPRYLRIEGRPVLVLYLSRTLTGNVSGLINGARALLERHGYDPYLIGDEIFWRVTEEYPSSSASWFTQTPQASRVRLFDAITAYALYAGASNDPLVPWRDFEGYPGTTSLVADELALYRRYLAASGGRVPVIPDVMPGTNTRGVRLTVNESAEPRQWMPGQSPGSTLQHYLDQIAQPVISARLPMVFVTSWNEWNEDTAIQPTGGTPTARDDSPSGTAYTQGYSYGGEGSTDLDVIRNFVGMAWGQVRTSTGKGMDNVRVTATQDGHVVSQSRTDQDGWYVLPRTSTDSGSITVVAGRNTRSRTFTISASTAKLVNFHSWERQPPNGRRATRVGIARFAATAARLRGSCRN